MEAFQDQELALEAARLELTHAEEALREAERKNGGPSTGDDAQAELNLKRMTALKKFKNLEGELRNMKRMQVESEARPGQIAAAEPLAASMDQVAAGIRAFIPTLTNDLTKSNWHQFLAQVEMMRRQLAPVLGTPEPEAAQPETQRSPRPGHVFVRYEHDQHVTEVTVEVARQLVAERRADYSAPGDAIIQPLKAAASEVAQMLNAGWKTLSKESE